MVKLWSAFWIIKEKLIFLKRPCNSFFIGQHKGKNKDKRKEFLGSKD